MPAIVLCICSKRADQAGRDLTSRSRAGNADHAPTAKFLQETAWETVREYYRK